MKKKSILSEKSFAFAIRIVNLYKFPVEKNKEFVLSKQILRSGTSIGANIREAYNAESKKDFIHKISVAQKECDETIYWLELLHKTEYLSVDLFISISNDAIELLKMIRSTIITSKSKLNLNGS